MIEPDAVVVFTILGLDLAAIFALVRVAVTVAILVLLIRIPFKRRYHWMFLVLILAMLWYSVASALGNTSTATPTSLSWNWWQQWANTKVQALLIFQFVICFVGGTARKWEKYVLLAGYAFVVAAVWVPLLVDPSFVVGATTVKTATGVTTTPGTGDAYLRPNGIDLYVTVMVLPIFFSLIRHYVSEKSALVRGQTKYLMVGIIFFYAGAYAIYFARLTGGPNFLNLFGGAGAFVLLMGLRRKGFYSVTPVSESAARALPRYLLEGGRSYLVHDNREGFEAFSSLVRSGRQGLVVTQSYPEDVRKDYDLRNTPVLWLAESKGDGVIPPSDLLGLSLTVKDFLERAVEPVVILHGIEYLTAYNGFSPIYRLINGIEETNAARRGVLILPVTPKSLEQRDEALLVSETTPMPSREP